MLCISGVYSITNIVNGKRYVGSSVRMRHRWGVHVYYLRRGKHHSPVLQNAWIKHGESAFRFDIIEECAGDKVTLLAREDHWLSVLAPEYNISRRARSNLGAVFPEKARANMRAAHASRGPHAEQWKRNISDATKGPRVPYGPPTEAHRQAISAAKKGCVSPMKGRHCSDQHKENIAQAQRGKPRSYADTSAARHLFNSLSDAEKQAFHAKRREAILSGHQRKRERAAVAAGQGSLF